MDQYPGSIYFNRPHTQTPKTLTKKLKIMNQVPYCIPFSLECIDFAIEK